MLQTQSFLHSQSDLGKGDIEALELLCSQFGIRCAFSETDPLVILNYQMIDSDKQESIVRECRGLTLELGTWKVIARAFSRFFNAGECPEEEKAFDWNSFDAYSKEDGSLVLLYWYGDTWRVNTRGSFALGEMSPGLGKNWEEVFYGCIDEVGMDSLPRDVTYVFELCSPYNKIVRYYSAPTAFLLSAFSTAGNIEAHPSRLNEWASWLHCKRPAKIDFRSLTEIITYLESHDDPTFEGVVLRDKNGMRLKVKSSRYVALHHLHGNGNIFLPKYIIPLILSEDTSELFLHFPEVAPKTFDLAAAISAERTRMNLVWQAARNVESQKDFANYVTKHSRLSSLLFRARKNGVEPETIWSESGNFLSKHFSENYHGPMGGTYAIRN